ncbi:MAG: DUF177 domain-containing protein [Acutalibacteraceae bacterium]|nr:DUF177 domain-containing protein [Acutalibacteraceae bacterium]
MIIDLRDMFVNIGQKQELSYTFDMSDFEYRGEKPLANQVVFKGQIVNRAGVVSLSGSVNTDYVAKCDRCGVDATEKIDFDIDYTLVTSLDSNEEKDGFIVLSDYKLDIEEVVKTDVVLFLPTKHLCKADCMGICSGCGANLNTGVCSCRKEQSAFGQALKKLLEQ